MIDFKERMPFKGWRDFMDRKGFGYITAVLILGLFAFMGLFLIQSSSAEYSQAAESVYRTMARQLAEAAADEAFFLLEKELKDGTADGKKGPILVQCAESKLPYESGETSGLNPTLLDHFNNYRKAAVQTEALTLTHIKRPSITIESIQVDPTSVRPIDHGWFSAEQCIYHPKDRMTYGFNTPLSRDYQLSLTVSVKIGIKIGSRKRFTVYRQARDVKVVNIGPIARPYSLFSCIGIDGRVLEDVKNDLNRGEGRLVLWNIPFQSRVYIHGPAVIGLENPDKGDTDNVNGAYISAQPEIWPGMNQAFQYDVTYAGLSYVPYPGRALWKKRSMFAGATMEDLQEMTDSEKAMYEHNTYKNKGFIPKLGPSWSELKQWFSFGDSYVRGNLRKQVFLPAGPFCRMPWKFVSDKPTSYYKPNTIGEGWPRPSKDLKIEHAWDKNNNTIDDTTKIYSEMTRFRLYQAGTFAGVSVIPPTLYPEFSVTYGNPRDSEGILDSIFILTENAFKTFWGAVSTPVSLVTQGVTALVHKIIQPKDKEIGGPIDFSAAQNFFPTNFKNFQKSACRIFKSVKEIPKYNGDEGIWLLDGVYWLRSLQTTGDVYYKGKGIIFVGDWFEEEGPATIRGNILKYTEDTLEKTQEHHLTLVYYPLPQAGALPNDPGFLNKCQLVIEGTGKKIEASVFSFAGIKTTAGKLSNQDYLDLGFNPNLPTGKWKIDWKTLHSKVTSICGNYVTYLMKKHQLAGDLWVFHENQSPYYYRKTHSDPQKSNQVIESCELSEEVRFHTVSFSPIPRHINYTGGGSE